MYDLNEIAKAIPIIETALNREIFRDPRYQNMMVGMSHHRNPLTHLTETTLYLRCRGYSFVFRLRSDVMFVGMTAAEVAEKFVEDFRKQTMNADRILGKGHKV